MNAAQQLLQQLESQTSQVMFGAEQSIRTLTIALIAAGHVLLEGPPGLGKTLLARSLARQLGGKLGRIQCTPDLMPADMTGTHVLKPESSEFSLMPGPLFSDVVLVDEINRTGPKTQSALLEAMEERRVTIDRNSYPLPDNFMVIATQNPMEFEGTFPLPESQLDRFALKLQLDYPGPEIEEQVLRAYDRPEAVPGQNRSEKLNALETFGSNALEQARAAAAAVTVSPAVYRYVTGIAEASRHHPQLKLGLSTRGALALMRCARAEAALSGAEFVTPDHVKSLAPAVLTHRLVSNPEAALEDISSAEIAGSILRSVPVPRNDETSSGS